MELSEQIRYKLSELKEDNVLRIELCPKINIFNIYKIYFINGAILYLELDERK